MAAIRQLVAALLPPLLSADGAHVEDDAQPEQEPGVPKLGSLVAVLLLVPTWFSVYVLVQLCGDSSDPTGCHARRSSAVAIATVCVAAVAVAVTAGVLFARKWPAAGVPVVWLTVAAELLAIAPVAYLYGAWLL